MIGELDGSHKEVTVIGGGLAGLLAAYELDRAGFRVTLHERAPRLGGLIHTRSTPYGIAESAMHSLLASQVVQDIASDLGVELVRVHPGAKGRFISREGKFSKFPLKWNETLTMAKKALTYRSSRPSPTSLSEWTRAYLGDAVLDYLVTPAVTGVYAAKPESLSIEAAFPFLAVAPGQTFFQAIRSYQKQQPKSGPRPLMTARLGMGDWIDKLTRRLETRLGDRLHTNSSVSSIPKGQNVVIATEAHSAARLLQNELPEVAHVLGTIRYLPMVTATVFVRKSLFPEGEPRGVGVLFPPSEKRKILGILFNSSAFPNRVVSDEWVSLTVLMGGEFAPERVQQSDAELQNLIAEDLRTVFKLSGFPEHYELTRWIQALPVYDEAITRLKGLSLPRGVVLAGNYAGQISGRGIMESTRAWTQRLPL